MSHSAVHQFSAFPKLPVRYVLPFLPSEVKTGPMCNSSEACLVIIQGLQLQAHRIMELAVENEVQLDAWSFSSLIKGHVRSGDMTQVGAVLDTMKQANVLPNVVSYFISFDAPYCLSSVPFLCDQDFHPF